jgi:hypothetical protein
VDVDEVFGDLSEEEAEEVVTEVFETAYGDDADGILDQIQDTLGLDFRQILDILVGSSSDDADDDAYGEGATDDVEEVDSSVGSVDDGTGTFGGEFEGTDEDSRFLVDSADDPVDSLTGADAWDGSDPTADAESPDLDPDAGGADAAAPELG